MAEKMTPKLKNVNFLNNVRCRWRTNEKNHRIPLNFNYDGQNSVLTID
jgi:hypothetical protein